MVIQDIMTRHVTEVPPGASLREAAEKMRSLDVGILPVCDGRQLVGILTDRDIAMRAVAEGRDPQRTKVSDAMTPEVLFCYADEDVVEAAKLMEQRQVRRLLVLDRNHHAVGIVSLGDLAVRSHDDRRSGEVLERVSEPMPPGMA